MTLDIYFFFLSWWVFEASETYMKGVLSFTDEELVSADFIHNVTLELRMDHGSCECAGFLDTRLVGKQFSMLCGSVAVVHI